MTTANNTEEVNMCKYILSELLLVPVANRRGTAWYSCFVGPPASSLPWSPPFSAGPFSKCPRVKGKKLLPDLIVLFACHAESNLQCVDILLSYLQGDKSGRGQGLG